MAASRSKKAREVVMRDLASLVPYAQNARTHSPDQVRAIARSITEYGWTNPVLLDPRGGIVAGHGRVLAAAQLGWKEVPTITLAGLSRTQIRAYQLADNKLAELAGWDERLLAQELAALKAEDYDLSLIGFEQVELDALLQAPDFQQAQDEPGRMDVKVTIKCPHCGHSFPKP